MSSPFRFNKSIRVEVRPDKVTGDTGVLLCRQVLNASGVDRWLSERIEDARDPRRIRHSIADLVRTACLLAAQSRRDHDDATVLRDDPAFRLASSGRAGTAPLAEGRGLASQPTLLRLTATLSRGRDPEVLREGLTNEVLKRLAELPVDETTLARWADPPEPGGRPRTWVHEPEGYQERAGDLFPDRLEPATAARARLALGRSVYRLGTPRDGVVGRAARHWALAARQLALLLDPGGWLPSI